MARKATWNHIRTYPFEFALILDEDVWKKELKRMSVPVCAYPDSAGGTTFFSSGKQSPRRAIVTLNPIKDLAGIQIASMLCHEAQHIVQYIEDEIGEEKFSHEAECYLLQNIVQDLMQDYVEMGGHPREAKEKNT